MNIAFCVDNTYSIPLAATLHSIKQANADIFIVSRGVSEKNKHRLDRIAPIHWLDANDLPVDDSTLHSSDNISVATYDRVMLPSLVTCDKVIYLDVDTIVQGDLTPLWEKDMKGHVVLAVRDAAVYTIGSHMGVRAYEELGLPADAPYFNGGMLVIDCRRWREEKIFDRFVDYTRRYGHLSRWYDQDGLNVALYGKWRLVEERWNLQTTAVDAYEVRGHPQKLEYVARLRATDWTTDSYIMHYTRGRKPWHPLCTHPYRHLFHKHFSASGLFGPGERYLWYAQQYAAWTQRKSMKHRSRRLTSVQA